jgi:RNA polymerase sigma-70 factor, ECF subfamily
MGVSANRWSDEAAIVAAATGGDESAFSLLFERYRQELRVHCYRMLGSFDESEDLVQETFLRAWRSRGSFRDEGPSSFRGWLYRVATNASIDVLRARPRRRFPWQSSRPERSVAALAPPDPELAWLQPYPDQLLEGIAPSDEQPESETVRRETIELAFIVAIQLLPPAQRAVLIARDVLGWSAKETAEVLETSVASVNSSLQRARATLRRHLPSRRSEWAPPSDPTEEERALLQRYVAAHEQRDHTTFAKLLREDARLTMPPTPSWFEGREAIVGLFAGWLDPASPAYVGEVRRIPIGANRQPAFAGYIRRPGEADYRPLGLELLRIEDGTVAEITLFVTTDLFAAFGLPQKL